MKLFCLSEIAGNDLENILDDNNGTVKNRIFLFKCNSTWRSDPISGRNAIDRFAKDLQ